MYVLEIQVLAWDEHKYEAGFNQLMGFPPSPSWTPTATDINKW